MGVYTFASKPTTPGERTPDLLIRFQAVSRTQPCVHYRFMSVHSRTKLIQVRRYITKYFKNVYETGFVFLCKTKEILKSDENKLTVFDILPKIPEISSGRTPGECFQYPDVQYKKVWYNYEGKRYHCMCACVIFMFERSKVSHWPQEVLREELAASAIDGFSHIPTDIMSWSGKLVECRGTPLHIYAALGKKEELATAIHQLQDGTTAKALKDQRGATPLHYAAANGKLDECEILVAGVGSEMIYHTDNWKRSPLHRALYSRRAPTITYLIQMNADVDTPDYNGNSCIDLLYKQKPKDIEFIVSKLETDCVDNRVRYCLMYLSLMNKKFSHVRKIADAIKPAPETKLGTTFLHLSAKYKLTDVTKALLERGFERSERDLMEFLPFHIACKSGALDQITLLLYPNISDADLNRGIELSVRSGHVEVCREIYTFRPDIELEESTVCMVKRTVQSMLRKFKLKTVDEEPLKHFEAVAGILLPITKSLPGILDTYAFDCALYGASETLILLKSLGANFNTCDYSGRSPLHEAAQMNKLRCTQVLLKGGADPNVSDWRRSTPLHYACEKGNNNIVKCLMENKDVKANIKDAQGRTPLLVAGYRRRDETIVYLLKYCDKVVDLTVSDKNGYGLLHYGLHLKESTLDLIIEKLSGKPKPLYDEEPSKAKQKIRDSSWIPNVVNTAYKAVYNEDSPRRSFSLSKNIKASLWRTREEELRWSRTIKKPPEIEYEQCSGCRHLIKPSVKHKCGTPKDKRNKKTKLKAFRFYDKSNEKDKTMVSAFFLAVKTGNTLSLKKIKKLDPTASSYRDELGRNCLELAIDLRSLRLVKAVIELCPDVDKANVVQKVVSLPKASKKECTQLQLLVYLFSVNCKINSSNDQTQGDLVLATAIKEKNSDIIDELVNHTDVINDETMVLAASSGVPDIVVRIFKKWRKNKSRKVNAIDIIGVACSSKNLSVEVVKCLLTNQKSKDNTAAKSSEESSKYAEDLCKALKIPVVKRKSLLGKLLNKRHPARRAKPPVSTVVFNDIGQLLINHDQEMGIDPTGQVHVACECLQDCIEIKCYQLAEAIIKKSAAVVWSCELSDRRCSFQRNFQKKLYNFMSKKLVDVSYLQNLILIASHKDVPENILYLILKNGATFFHSDEGLDTVVDVDIFPKEGSFQNVENIGDNMVRLILTVLELLTGEKFPKQDLLKLWRHVPGVLQYVSLLTRKLNCDEFVRTKEDQFLRHCYKDVVFQPGTNVLHVASGWQDFGALKMLFKAVVPIDVNAENEEGVTPLDVAATFGYWQHYKLLMDNGSMVTDLTLERCCLKDTELVGSIMLISDKSMANDWSNWLRKRTGSRPYKQLIGHTPDKLQPKARLKIFQDIWSRLEVEQNGKILKEDSDLVNACCLFKLWEVVEFCLDKGSHLIINSLYQQKGWYSEIPETISSLCQYSPIPVVKKFMELIDKHAKKLTEKVLGEVILFLVRRNENEICNHLISKTLASLDIESYDNLLKTVDLDGKSAIHHLAINGNQETLTFFIGKMYPCNIRRSPVLDVRDKLGLEPLWYALANQNWSCAELLLIGGCCPSLLRGVPDFDTRRQFRYEKQEPFDKIFPVDIITTDTPRRAIHPSLPSSIGYCYNYSGNSGYRFSLGSRFGKLFDLPNRGLKEEFKVNKRGTAMKVLKTTRSKGQRRIMELIRLSTVAKNNGAALVHVAYANGDQQLITKFLKIQPAIVNLKDNTNVLPTTYALIHGHQNIEHQNQVIKDPSQIQPLVWKFMAVGNRYERLTYSLTQLLFLVGWRYSENLDRIFHRCSHGKIFLEKGNRTDDDLGLILKSITTQHLGLKSAERVQEYKSFARDTLTKSYTESSVINFIGIFKYLQSEEFDKHYNKYSFLCNSDQNTEGSIGVVLKREFSSMHVDDITNDVWAVLLMSGEPWVLERYLDMVKKSETKKLSDPLLLDLSVFDLLPLYVRSSDETDPLRLDQKTIEQMKELLQAEKGLSLRSEIVKVAVHKQLWPYLELIGLHTLVEIGVLNPVWQTVMARAAETGNLSFIKGILSSLEVTKMTNEQKACFTAFICISSLHGHLDIVKYLVRNRIPMVCYANDPAFQNLLQNQYVPSWGVLEYAVKGNSRRTFEFLLQCYKEDREIRNTIQVNVLIELASQKGNVEIFKLLSKYSDRELGSVLSRADLEKAYKLSLFKGREKFCLQLLENSNTSLVVYSDDKESSLHFASIHGMFTLASKMIQERPEILNAADRHGHVALDYANVCGNTKVARLLEENKAELSSNWMQRCDCYGWFHNYILENEKKERIENDFTKPYKTRNRNTLDLLSVLRMGSDHMGEYIVSTSKYLIKDQLRSNFSDTVSLYMKAAESGCNNSLSLLLQIISQDDNLVTKVMSHESKKQETVLSLAVKNKHLECIKVVMEYDVSWQRRESRDNALHAAVQTGKLNLVVLVDEKSKGTLRTQTNQHGATPIIYAAALGEHNIVAYLSSGTSLVSSAHDNHTTVDQTDYYCMDCLLDLCIGWSKLYQNKTDHTIQERVTRPIHVEDKFCRLFFKRQKAVVNRYSSSALDHETTSEHLLQVMMRLIPKSCTVWQHILICMGYNNSDDVLHELLLRLPSHDKEPMMTKMKKVMAKPEFTKTLIRFAEKGPFVDDLLLSAAASGNDKFLTHFSSRSTVDEDRSSLNEIAFAFGNTTTALYLQQKSNTIYEVFHDLDEVIPLRIKWMTGLEKPGDKAWLKSVSEDPLVGKLSVADFWIISNFQDSIVEAICSDTEPNSLIPQTLADKKYSVDIESFKRNNPSYSNEINHRAYITSSLVYGRQLAMFANDGNGKLKTTQTIKVICEASGPGNLPKIHVDQSGNYQESVVISTGSTGTFQMTDNSFKQKTEEMMVRNYIIADVVPEVSSLVVDVFQRDVKLRIDWLSLESRRRTGNYDLLLKLLSGDSNRNLLGGLYDVLNQCQYIRQDIYDMYDESTVNLALQPLSHIQEVVITYVDTIQESDSSRKPRSTSMSDVLTWEFTYEKNTLKYNRENFPLLTTLKRYQQLGGAIYNAVYRITSLDPNTTKQPIGYTKPPERITLEIDIKSFGVKNETIIHEKLCQGVSREVDAIACECEAMLRLSINARKVLLRNSSSAQGTGISLQDSTVIVSICVSMNSQKTITVERGQICQKLEELEDQQLFCSWQPEQLDSVKHEIESTTQVLKSGYGFSIQTYFDEKRLMVYAFQRYRREMTHPHALMSNMMMKCCKRISDALLEIIFQLFDGIPVDYVMYLNKDKTVPNGMWSKVPEIHISPNKENGIYMTLKTVNKLVKIRDSDDDENIKIKREEYSCKWMNITKEKYCWKHSSFETTHIYPRKENNLNFGLISLSNQLYRITDTNKFREVLAKFPGKVSITSDTFLVAESMSLLSMGEKLSLELERTLKTSKPFLKPSTIKEAEDRLLSCFDALKISRPDISIDFESFQRKHSSSKSDLCDEQETERNIVMAAYCFDDALTTLIMRYKYKVLQCSSFSDTMTGLKNILQSIGNIITRKAEEDQKVSGSKKKKSKVANPALLYTEEGVEVILTDAPVIGSLKNPMKKLLRDVFVTTLSKEVLKQVSIEMDISAKMFEVSHKHSEDLKFENAALWHSYLHPNGVLSLSRFHTIKVDKQGVMFQMKSESNLEVYVSFHEKHKEDSRSFKNIGHITLDSSVVDVFSGDTNFLRFGENKLRIKLHPKLIETVDHSLFGFEIVNMKSADEKSTETLKISATRLQILEEGVCCLFFIIPNDVHQKLYDVNFSLIFKGRNMKTYRNIHISEGSTTKKASLSSTFLKIKKAGWIKIGVQHGCTKDSEREEIRNYRHVRGNYVTDVFSANDIQYTSTYPQSYIIYRQRNNYFDFMRESPMKISRGTLEIIDEATEIRVRAICKVCGDHLYICTPFPELMPKTELIINKVDNGEEEHDTI